MRNDSWLTIFFDNRAQIFSPDISPQRTQRAQRLLIFKGFVIRGRNSSVYMVFRQLCRTVWRKLLFSLCPLRPLRPLWLIREICGLAARGPAGIEILKPSLTVLKPVFSPGTPEKWRYLPLLRPRRKFARKTRLRTLRSRFRVVPDMVQSGVCAKRLLGDCHGLETRSAGIRTRRT